MTDDFFRSRLDAMIDLYHRLAVLATEVIDLFGAAPKLAGPAAEAHQTTLLMWLGRAWRIHGQKKKDKNKLYALHAPEVECIGKGKARQPYEFCVKTSLAITGKSCLIVGARAFTGNPYDGHTLAAQLERTRILLEAVRGDPKPKMVLADVGYRGIDADLESARLIHRGKYKTLSEKQRKWLKRRQAIEPVIGHVKQDHGLRRYWLKGATGDALHAALCTTGFNLRRLLRAIARLGVGPLWRRFVRFVQSVTHALHFLTFTLPDSTSTSRSQTFTRSRALVIAVMLPSLRPASRVEMGA